MKIILILLLISWHNVKAGGVGDTIFKTGFESFIQKLNDTGITWGGDYPSGNNTGCTSNIPSPQDCNTGRDFTHNDNSDGHAGFSFTKLDASGIALADQSVDYQTTPWACVRDNVTGLVWEIKTITAGIHFTTNTYHWGGLTALGRDHPDREGPYIDDWNGLVQGSNDDTLCGFDDWRAPSVTELTSIVNNGTSNPAIDINYFPNTPSLADFWASSPDASNDGGAWRVDSSHGFVGIKARADGGRMRLVSSSGK